MRGVLVVILAAAAGACGRSEPGGTSGARSVTVYVSTDRVFSEPVLRDYERRSGVKVNAVYDTEETKSTGLANRLLAEKPRPQADVFWSNEPVRTLVLKSRDVLAPYKSPSETSRTIKSESASCRSADMKRRAAASSHFSQALPVRT